MSASFAAGHEQLATQRFAAGVKSSDYALLASLEHLAARGRGAKWARAQRKVERPPLPANLSSAER